MGEIGAAANTLLTMLSNFRQQSDIPSLPYSYIAGSVRRKSFPFATRIVGMLNRAGQLLWNFSTGRLRYFSIRP